MHLLNPTLLLISAAVVAHCAPQASVDKILDKKAVDALPRAAAAIPYPSIITTDGAILEPGTTDPSLGSVDNGDNSIQKRGKSKKTSKKSTSSKTGKTSTSKKGKKTSTSKKGKKTSTSKKGKKTSTTSKKGSKTGNQPKTGKEALKKVLAIERKLQSKYPRKSKRDLVQRSSGGETPPSIGSHGTINIKMGQAKPGDAGEKTSTTGMWTCLGVTAQDSTGKSVTVHIEPGDVDRDWSSFQSHYRGLDHNTVKVMVDYPHPHASAAGEPENVQAQLIQLAQADNTNLEGKIRGLGLPQSRMTVHNRPAPSGTRVTWTRIGVDGNGGWIHENETDDIGDQVSERSSRSGSNRGSNRGSP